MASTTKKTSPPPSQSTASKSTASKTAANKSTASKTTASKSTAGKTAASKTAASKPVSQAIAFTEDPADQELLEAIAEELADQTFDSFEHLCKEALRYFLFEDEVLPGEASGPVNLDSDHPAPTSLDLGPLQQQLAQLEQKLESGINQPFAILQQQLASLEKALVQQGAQPITALAAQIQCLVQQVARLEASPLPVVSFPEPTPADNFPTAISQPRAPVSPKARGTDDEGDPPATPALGITLDPRLARLSVLLEDF